MGIPMRLDAPMFSKLFYAHLEGLGFKREGGGGLALEDTSQSLFFLMCCINE